MDTDSYRLNEYLEAMALQQPCDKCVELWREYGAATRAHVELLKEQERIAGLDHIRFMELDPRIEFAAIRRDAARGAIKIHLATEHPNDASAQYTMSA